MYYRPNWGYGIGRWGSPRGYLGAGIGYPYGVVYGWGYPGYGYGWGYPGYGYPGYYGGISGGLL